MLGGMFAGHDQSGKLKWAIAVLDKLPVICTLLFASAELMERNKQLNKYVILALNSMYYNV